MRVLQPLQVHGKPAAGALGWFTCPSQPGAEASSQRREGGRLTPPVPEEAGIIFSHHGDVGMLGAQRALHDRQGASVEGFGRLILALGLMERGQVVEAHGGGRMLRAQYVLADRQGALVEGFGRLIGLAAATGYTRPQTRGKVTLCRQFRAY
jgi:hypothetical protein